MTNPPKYLASTLSGHVTIYAGDSLGMAIQLAEAYAVKEQEQTEVVRNRGGRPNTTWVSDE